eukprot:66906_1
MTSNICNNTANTHWEAICSYLSVESLACMKSLCSRLHKVISRSEYLVHQTLLRFFKNGKNIINCAGLRDDIDLEFSNAYNTLQNQTELMLLMQMFHPLCFNRLTMFNNSKLFRCYSRLMSFNWKLQFVVDKNACFPLLNVHNADKISPFKRRNLNVYEQTLFKNVNELNEEKQCTKPQETSSLIYNHQEFIINLEKETNYSEWKDIIFDDKDNKRFFLAGGKVLKCLLKSYQASKKLQDLDFFACNMDYNEFTWNVQEIISQFQANGFAVTKPEFAYDEDTYESHVVNLYVNFSPTNISDQIFKAKHDYFHKLHPLHPNKDDFNNRSSHFRRLIQRGNLIRLLREIKHKHKLKCIQNGETSWQKLQFIHICKGYNPWSILHVFDIDACQVGFDGNDVLSTYAFVESINTNTMINYKLIDNIHMYYMFKTRT